MFGPIGTSGGASSAIQLALILTLISLAPAIVLSCTTFARFVVVFSFLRTGLGTAGAPPSQVRRSCRWIAWLRIAPPRSPSHVPRHGTA